MQSRPSWRIACRPVGSRCLPLKQGKRLQNNSFRRPHCRSCMTPFAFATHLFVAALSESNIAIASDYEEPVRKLSAAYLSAASPPTPLHRNLANADSLLRIAYASSSSGLRIRRAASSSLLQLHGCRIWPRQYSNSRTPTRCLAGETPRNWPSLFPALPHFPHFPRSAAPAVRTLQLPNARVVAVSSS